MKLLAGKSPGSNGVVNEILSAVVRWNSFLLLKAFKCLSEVGDFPKIIEDGQGSPCWMKLARL